MVPSGIVKVEDMLKKRLGAEAIGNGWNSVIKLRLFYKIPTTLIIPEGVEKIGNFAFCDCWDLKKVVIPMSVKSIGCDAFVSCWRLKKVIIPESVEEIRNYAFSYCNNLREVVIPESVKRIGHYAFYGCENAEIIVGKWADGFEFLGNYAFTGCKIHVKEKTRD